jgi:hypothetical protein
MCDSATARSNRGASHAMCDTQMSGMQCVARTWVACSCAARSVWHAVRGMQLCSTQCVARSAWHAVCDKVCLTCRCMTCRVRHAVAGGERWQPTRGHWRALQQRHAELRASSCTAVTPAPQRHAVVGRHQGSCQACTALSHKVGGHQLARAVGSLHLAYLLRVQRLGRETLLAGARTGRASPCATLAIHWPAWTTCAAVA